MSRVSCRRRIGLAICTPGMEIRCQTFFFWVILLLTEGCERFGQFSVKVLIWHCGQERNCLFPAPSRSQQKSWQNAADSASGTSWQWCDCKQPEQHKLRSQHTGGDQIVTMRRSTNTEQSAARVESWDRKEKFVRETFDLLGDRFANSAACLFCTQRI